MPRFREILAQGRMVPMHVTLPEISAVSWSSFMTGKNPGEHGIFGFTDLKEDGKSMLQKGYDAVIGLRDVKSTEYEQIAGKKIDFAHNYEYNKENRNRSGCDLFHQVVRTDISCGY